MRADKTIEKLNEWNESNLNKWIKVCQMQTYRTLFENGGKKRREFKKIWKGTDVGSETEEQYKEDCKRERKEEDRRHAYGEAHIANRPIKPDIFNEALTVDYIIGQRTLQCKPSLTNTVGKKSVSLRRSRKHWPIGQIGHTVWARF